MVNNHSELDAVFGALADATRRGMVARLAQGATTIGELGRPYPITKGAVTKHVKVLERAGLLRRSVQGRSHLCEMRTDPLADAQLWIDRIRSFWDDRLDDLAQYLDEIQSKQEGAGDDE